MIIESSRLKRLVEKSHAEFENLFEATELVIKMDTTYRKICNELRQKQRNKFHGCVAVV